MADQNEFDELKRLSEQVELVTKQQELVAAQKALDAAQQETPSQIADLQKILDDTNKKNEVLDAELKALQTQKAILTEGLPTGETKPRSGEVTVDESRRFLSEIVAYHALLKVGEAIAPEIITSAKEQKGILIVDDFSCAIDDVFYLDIKNKLDKLNAIANNYIDESDKLLKDTSVEVEKKKPVNFPYEEVGENEPVQVKITDEEMGAKGQLGSADEERSAKEKVKAFGAGAAALGTGTMLAGVATEAISGGLSAVGDIVGYFRSDYAIKGQNVEDLNDSCIQAMVIEKLSKANKNVYLLNFHFILESKLMNSLAELFNKRMTIIINTEKINSKYISAQESQVQALETILVSLRDKWIEYLLKDEIVKKLEFEIANVENKLKNHTEQGMPDSQITALEKYMADLLEKLVNELAKDSESAKVALEKEIEEITKQLDGNEQRASEEKLSPTKAKELKDRLKTIQSRLVDVIANTGNRTKDNLVLEIDKITALLQEAQSKRVRDTYIRALETHLSDLQTKLRDCLINGGDEAKEILEEEIQEIAGKIEENKNDLLKAKGAVINAVKIGEAIDAFNKNITTVPSGSAYSPFVAACVREHFRDEKIGYILRIKLVSSGVDFVTETLPFWKFWQHNPDTFYYGGGVVSYVMAQKDGQIVASGTKADVAAMQHKIGSKSPELLPWGLN